MNSAKVIAYIARFCTVCSFMHQYQYFQPRDNCH